VNLVAFARFHPVFEIEGMIFSLMVIVLAAGEAAVALAIVLKFLQQPHDRGRGHGRGAEG